MGKNNGILFNSWDKTKHFKNNLRIVLYFAFVVLYLRRKKTNIYPEQCKFSAVL